METVRCAPGPSAVRVRSVPHSRARGDDVAARRGGLAGRGRLAGHRTRRRAGRSVPGRHRGEPRPGRRPCCSAAWRLTGSRRSGFWSPPRSAKAVAIGPRRCWPSPASVQIWHLAVVVARARASRTASSTRRIPRCCRRCCPPDQLLAANGIEGMLRPTVMQAAGPALASAVIAVASPALAMASWPVAQLLAVVGLLVLQDHAAAQRRESGRAPGAPAQGGGDRSGRWLPLPGADAVAARAPCCSRPSGVADHGSDRGAAAVRREGSDRRRARRLRPGHRGVRRGRGHRFAAWWPRCRCRGAT